MRMRPFALARTVAVTCSAVGVGLVCALAEEPPAAKPDAQAAPAKQDKAEPQRPARNDSLKSLEENLFKPLQDTLAPETPDTLPRLVARPSPAQERKIKDAIDRKNNWVFMTPEELIA